MLHSRPLRIVLVVTPIVLMLAFVWLGMDLPAPKEALFASSRRSSPSMSAAALTELLELGKAAEKLRTQGADGTERDLLHSTREDARTRAAEFLRSEIIAQSPTRVASAVSALRSDDSNRMIDPDASWRPLLLIGKALSLRAEAIMVTEGPDGAWRQVLQGLEFAETLYRSANSLPQFAIARSIQGFFARTICAAIAAREWPPAVLAAVAKVDVGLRLGPQLLRGLEHEYASSVALARAESDRSPTLVQRVLYQPNRTEVLWSRTLEQAVRALKLEKPAVAYHLATSTPQAREQAPIFWRNWLGYKHSVPAIQSCINIISQIANAELQMQLVRLAANIGRHRAEVGAFPQNLQLLADRFPETNIQDPWVQDGAHLRYDASTGNLYSIGPNETDEHLQITQSFETSPASDDYGVRLVP